MSLGFNPKDDAIVRIVREQALEWGMEDAEATYVVVDDCGPCIIASFAFRHHAEAFLSVCGQECYMADYQGNEVAP